MSLLLSIQLSPIHSCGLLDINLLLSHISMNLLFFAKKTAAKLPISQAAFSLKVWFDDLKECLQHRSHSSAALGSDTDGRVGKTIVRNIY